MRSKECGKEPSVPFPWSLAVHHQSLAFRARLYDAKNEAPEEEACAATSAGRTRVIMFLADSQNTIIHHKKEKVYMLSIKNILQQFIPLIHRTFFIKSGHTIQVIWVKFLYAC